ncbi:helix-turn-helix domain-containing protein [Microvirga brassicacearum]|uniref:Helix-turn-helix domain-containing protein n=1 Tax=Microvirga brassicacearum TaxID=2580413 RepID=A0A5N3PGY7_9HYPH|nr:helix-turn-helix domain-containing protein [Microvirga brassicacearum]KAB0269004.1 helix-turn-helix domain-containing protein [Microvirga brassicacearum]
MSRERRDVLPISCPPRGLSRVEAAAYVGVSPTTFDRMISEGVMPKAKRYGSRVIWDRLALDSAFMDLPDEAGAYGHPSDEPNPWDLGTS